MWFPMFRRSCARRANRALRRLPDFDRSASTNWTVFMRNTCSGCESYFRYVSLVISICAACAWGDIARGAVILDTPWSGVSATTGKALSAHVVFSRKNPALPFVVTNPGAAAEAPADVLTGVFFNVNQN